MPSNASRQRHALAAFDGMRWLGVLCTTLAVLLDRWTSDRSKRTKDTAVSGVRFQESVAGIAFIVIPARIRWHGFGLFVPTLRASQGRFQYGLNHCSARHQSTIVRRMLVFLKPVSLSAQSFGPADIVISFFPRALDYMPALGIGGGGPGVGAAYGPLEEVRVVSLGSQA